MLLMVEEQYEQHNDMGAIGCYINPPISADSAHQNMLSQQCQLCILDANSGVTVYIETDIYSLQCGEVFMRYINPSSWKCSSPDMTGCTQISPESMGYPIYEIP